MVVSDNNAEYRQFQVSKRMIVSALGLCVLGVAALVSLSLVKLELPSSQKELQGLREENDALKIANNRYLEASIDMEKKLKLFGDKTEKLALYVGIESPAQEMGGVGGPVFRKTS